LAEEQIGERIEGEDAAGPWMIYAAVFVDLFSEPTSTSAAAGPFSGSGKGSNDRPSPRAACSITRRPPTSNPGEPEPPFLKLDPRLKSSGHSKNLRNGHSGGW
jgi:hypothetical protein